MKELFELGNKYAQESDWKDFAAVKFCLCAMGVLIGTFITTKHKPKVRRIAGSIFLITYIPLMYKVFKIATKK